MKAFTRLFKSKDKLKKKKEAAGSNDEQPQAPTASKKGATLDATHHGSSTTVNGLVGEWNETRVSSFNHLLEALVASDSRGSAARGI